MTAKAIKKNWISLLLTLLCVAVVVAVCAMASGCSKEGMHIITEDNTVQIVKGELDVSLVRERLETRTIGEKGLIQTTIVEHPSIDFSNSNKNIFGLDKDVLVGPTCSFKADMAISNRKPYAFEYWLEIIPVRGENLLADQLELTVTLGEELFIKRTLQDGLTTKTFPAVASGSTAFFTAKLEYLDTKNNNETKNTTFAFDMVVHTRLIAS